MEKEKLELSSEIDKFLEKYALIRDDFDPIYEDPEQCFVGEDAKEFFLASRALEKGEKPKKIFSNWHGGCYNTTLDPLDGFDVHETLKRKVIFFS